MFTRCPHCETRFRIRAQEIRAAGGKVHCGHCNDVFNAIETLYDQAPEHDEGHPPDAAPGVPETPRGEGATPATESSAREPTRASGVSAEREPGDESPLPFEIPDNLPELEPAARAAPGPTRSTGRSLAWGASALVLLTLALAQLAWYGRETLLLDPRGRAILAPFCKFVDCDLPHRSAPEEIVILSRSIASHPAHPDALRLALTFANEARFPQRYPNIQLSFFDSAEALVARRLFEPAVYLGNPSRLPTHLSPGERVELTMDLRDPGAQVTGFKFDFF